jgi:chromate transporter
VLSVGILSSLFALAAVFAGDSLFAFLKFGCVAIGGGFPLVPFYSRTFVGPESALLQMRPEDFSNLMALTQMTPGPVSLNAATFFGYSLDGALGAVVASTALLTPSYFMLSSVLTGLNRCRNNPAVRVFLSLLTPVSVVLMSLALRQFCSVSIWESSSDGLVFRPYALCLAVFAAVMLEKRKLSVMALIFVCAALGALSVLAA